MLLPGGVCVGEAVRSVSLAAKPDLGPVCIDSAIKWDGEHPATVTLTPLLRSNGGGLEYLTLPGGHLGKSSLPPRNEPVREIPALLGLKSQYDV